MNRLFYLAIKMGNMEILRYILLILHLVGMAIIVGGYFTYMRSPRVVAGMLHASFLQLVTGLALVGVAEAMGGANHMKIGIKLVLAILVTVFAFIGNRKQKAHDQADGPQPSATMAHLTGVFAILAVIVAVTL